MMLITMFFDITNSLLNTYKLICFIFVQRELLAVADFFFYKEIFFITI